MATILSHKRLQYIGNTFAKFQFNPLKTHELVIHTVCPVRTYGKPTRTDMCIAIWQWRGHITTELSPPLDHGALPRSVLNDLVHEIKVRSINYTQSISNARLTIRFILTLMAL